MSSWKGCSMLRSGGFQFAFLIKKIYDILTLTVDITNSFYGFKGSYQTMLLTKFDEIPKILG